jgi:antirestriction protein ArdC
MTVWQPPPPTLGQPNPSRPNPVISARRSQIESSACSKKALRRGRNHGIPAKRRGMPKNPTTDRNYRGGNALHLMATALQRGYSDPRWTTYKQASDQGWQVRRGEKGTQIEFWEVKPADKDVSPGENAGASSERNGRDGRDTRLIHRVYTVFNAKQIDGIPEYQPKRPTPFEVVNSAEQILDNSGAKITHDQADRAFYNRASDSIHLPHKDAFKDAAGYYGTALHELAHSTGHPSRLDRPTLNASYRFGDTNYAKEELRAELRASSSQPSEAFLTTQNSTRRMLGRGLKRSVRTRTKHSEWLMMLPRRRTTS